MNNLLNLLSIPFLSLTVSRVKSKRTKGIYESNLVLRNIIFEETKFDHLIFIFPFENLVEKIYQNYNEYINKKFPEQKSIIKIDKNEIYNKVYSFLGVENLDGLYINTGGVDGINSIIYSINYLVKFLNKHFTDDRPKFTLLQTLNDNDNDNDNKLNPFDLKNREQLIIYLNDLKDYSLFIANNYDLNDEDYPEILDVEEEYENEYIYDLIEKEIDQINFHLSIASFDYYIYSLVGNYDYDKYLNYLENNDFFYGVNLEFINSKIIYFYDLDPLTIRRHDPRYKIDELVREVLVKQFHSILQMFDFNQQKFVEYVNELKSQK